MSSNQDEYRLVSQSLQTLDQPDIIEISEVAVRLRSSQHLKKKNTILIVENGTAFVFSYRSCSAAEVTFGFQTTFPTVPDLSSGAYACVLEEFLVGYIEGFNSPNIHGWAANLLSTEPLRICLWIDGLLFSVTIPNRYRSDVIDIGSQARAHGFILPINHPNFHPLARLIIKPMDFDHEFTWVNQPYDKMNWPDRQMAQYKQRNSYGLDFEIERALSLKKSWLVPPLSLSTLTVEAGGGDAPIINRQVGSSRLSDPVNQAAHLKIMIQRSTTRLDEQYQKKLLDELRLARQEKVTDLILLDKPAIHTGVRWLVEMASVEGWAFEVAIKERLDWSSIIVAKVLHQEGLDTQSAAIRSSRAMTIVVLSEAADQPLAPSTEAQFNALVDGRLIDIRVSASSISVMVGGKEVRTVYSSLVEDNWRVLGATLSDILFSCSSKFGSRATGVSDIDIALIAHSSSSLIPLLRRFLLDIGGSVTVLADPDATLDAPSSFHVLAALKLDNDDVIRFCDGMPPIIRALDVLLKELS